MESQNPALLIRGLRFRYGPGSSANNGAANSHPWVVDVRALDLAPAEQLLLTGSSGCGKSTLLSLIAGLLEPQGGAVVVAGQNVHALAGARRDLFRGRHIGMIFQTFNLLHGFSALENVMAAFLFSGVPARQHRSRAAALLRHLGIERMDADPDSLSVGQQQRVAVARALACNPVLVLADEPTASLDPENSAAAIGLIQSACREKGAALLCVSHDPSVASRFERVKAFGDLNPTDSFAISATPR